MMTTKKPTVKPEVAFEVAAFMPGFWKCQILNQVVES
jgi:hypothetical protein